MSIDEYLAELERRLPRFRRRRVLREVAEHLRDAAARRGSEGAAVLDFGPVELVANRLRSELAVGETRLATALALGATALFVHPLYVVPENTLPPATWVEKPRDIALLQLVVVALWLLAGALAGASAILAWTRLARFAAPALATALVALAASTLVSAALVVRWFDAAPATPEWPLLAAPLAAACLGAVAAAFVWTRERAPLLISRS